MRYLIIICTLLLIFSSCNSEKFETSDPVADIESLLRSSQVNLVQLSGGSFAGYSGMITQQISGISGKMLEFERYNITTHDVDAPWQICYLYVLSNLNKVIHTAESRNLYKVAGISRILMAHTLGMATDVWGSIPFKKSYLTSMVHLYPTYDSQEEIYNQIFNLLETGISQIPPNSSLEFPTEGDLFFEGNPEKWVAYANFLRVRYSLHLSKRNGYANLIDLLNLNLFTSTNDTVAIDFSKVTSVLSPFFFFNQSNTGSLKAGNRLIGQMNTTNDPRLSNYFKFDSNNAYSGSLPGEANNTSSDISNHHSSSTAIVTIASYTEQKFIESEIFLMNGFTLEATEAYNEGLKSSLLHRKVWNENWYNQNKALTTPTLEQIITQKYISLFLQPEVWTDWRRTGFPLLISAENNYTNNVIPRRLPYPYSEYLNNTGNVPPNINLTQHLWWDITTQYHF